MKSSGGGNYQTRRMLLVDGYNILHAWSWLSADGGLETARERLVDCLQDYQGYSGQEIVVVFDSHLSRGNRQTDWQGKVQVIYTRRFETADHYIERLADQLSGDRRVQLRVATSDALEQSVVLSRGATRLSARELWDEIQSTRSEARRHMAPKIEKQALEGRLEASMREALEAVREKNEKKKR